MLITSPPSPCFRITLTPTCVTINCPLTRISYNKSQSFSVWSSRDLEIEIPALFTRMSTPPKDKEEILSASSTCAILVTSNEADAKASFPNCCLNSSSASFNLPGSLSLIMTHAPSATNFLAMALPIPPALPVMNAIFPDSALGFGMRCNLASSNNQYSMLKAS